MATSKRESKRPSEPDAEASNKRAAVTPADVVPATAVDSPPSDAADSARTAPVAGSDAQLPFRTRGLGENGLPNVDASTWQTLDFVVWKENVSEARVKIVNAMQRELSLAKKHGPELWACDINGNPVENHNVDPVDLLQWRATDMPRPAGMDLLLQHHSGTRRPRAFVLFTLPEATPPATSAVPLMGIDELDKELKTALKDVNWNAITQYPTMLSRSNAPAFAIDLPSFKKAGIPDMTLAPHPEDFYTRKHANDVITRLKVWRACARLRAC